MKILVCDRLEEKVLDKFEEIGEITNISESKTKNEDLISNIVDTEIVVIRSGTKINKDILENAMKAKRGVLILFRHTLYLELSARLLGRFFDIFGLERPNNNSLVQKIQTKFAEQFSEKTDLFTYPSFVGWHGE